MTDTFPEQGVHQMSADAYHADPAAGPSLSSSIAKLLINASPLHAWTEHPRLNPAYKSSDDKKYDVGTTAHAILLEGRDIVGLVEYDSWRTNAAKEDGEAHRQAGRVPLLGKDYDTVMRMVDAIRSQLDALDVDPVPFTNGRPEQTLVWQEQGVACRARLDWLRTDKRTIDDLKTTSRIGGANPESFSRSLFSMSYDVQAAFYLRGLRATTGADAEFRFVVVETAAPYALSVVSLLPSALELADDKVTWAIRKWRDCLADDSWPGYPTRVCYAEAPGWAEAQWMAREEREAA